MKIDINCDMGESFGAYTIGNDEEMMSYITSANIACGFHAGDPHVMRRTVELAKQYDVAIGSHPGLPDLMGFGRRRMTCTENEVKDFITYQMGALREFTRVNQVPIQHCKPHGAFYMQAMEDKMVARAILEAIHDINQETIVFAVNNSEMMEEANKMGIPVAREGYADREHTEDGSLILVRQGETIENYEKMAHRVVRMVKDKRVMTYDDKDATIEVDTVCIHSDTPGSTKLAKTIVEALKENNIEIAPVKEIL